jgi:selenocysteine lyase/cysteine desulfurase
MRIRRRRFLQGAGLVAGLAPFARARAAFGPASASASPFAFESWEQLRGEFPQDRSWRNFAGFLLAAPPRTVEEAVQFHRRELNRNAPNHLREMYRLEGEGRARAAEYLGVEAKQISMTGNTTMGLATLYNNLRIAPGQEVLTTEHEHYSCRTSIEYRAKREGFRVHTIRLYDEPRSVSTDEILGRIRKHVTAKTRVLALTWVHSGSSIKLPATEVSRLVAEINQGRGDEDRLLFCLDGVHGFGVENKSFDELGCDFFVAGTHKWIFGPSGTGIMCSRATALADISPTIPPFSFGGDESFGAQMTPGGFHAFEHRAAVEKAFELHLAIGKERVSARIHALNDHLKQRLEELPRVELVTPLGSRYSAGFTFFRIPGREAEEVEKILFENRIVASAADRDAGPVVRMAPGLMNSEDEIDAAVGVLKELG